MPKKTPLPIDAHLAEIVSTVAELDVHPDVREAIRKVLCRELAPVEASPECAAWVAKCYHEPSWHEQALRACNELLGGSGVEALEIDGADSYTDSMVRMCSPFTFVNMGDPYVVTLLRDHAAGAWIVSDLASVLDEYEQEHKLAGYEEFAECPGACPSCAAPNSELVLTAQPHSARGPESRAWVCQRCNHHAFAAESMGADEDATDED